MPLSFGCLIQLDALALYWTSTDCRDSRHVEWNAAPPKQSIARGLCGKHGDKPGGGRSHKGMFGEWVLPQRLYKNYQYTPIQTTRVQQLILTSLHLNQEILQQLDIFSSALQLQYIFFYSSAWCIIAMPSTKQAVGSAQSQTGYRMVIDSCEVLTSFKQASLKLGGKTVLERRNTWSDKLLK